MLVPVLVLVATSGRRQEREYGSQRGIDTHTRA